MYIYMSVHACFISDIHVICIPSVGLSDQRTVHVNVHIDGVFMVSIHMHALYVHSQILLLECRLLSSPAA